MITEVRVSVADSSDMVLLGRWLNDVPDVDTRLVPSPSGRGEQGGAWDFLGVLCGTTGAVKFALDALATWIESKATHARVKIGEVEVELRGPDPEALGRLMAAAGKVTRNES
jgi:hypothetical protein